MSSHDFSLHEALNVYISADAYIFEPANTVPFSAAYPNEKATEQVLRVDRRTGDMHLQSAHESSETGHIEGDMVITCYGIVGYITLATTEFLIIITSRTASCRLLSQSIYQATDFRLLPISSSSTTSVILDNPIEKELVSLVENGLRNGRLWFSYGWDLTNSLQRQFERAEKSDVPQDAISKEAIWRKADDRFFWNKYLMTRMIDQTERGGQGNDLSKFILPLLFGSIEMRQSSINNRDLLFCLISRRSRYRAGTRYFTRGIDPDGHTANYNETEQLVLLDPIDRATGQPLHMGGRVEGRERLSFVQVRGSVPVFWAEVNNLRYKPDLQIMDVPETISALRLHLAEQTRIYNEVWLVNLVNQKGHEQPVKEAFERAMEAIADPKAHYLYWDFHAECKGLRFDRIQRLVDMMSADLEKMGYFHVVMNPDVTTGTIKPDHRQTGVIRSNCMDCLDRTNVAQAALAKDALQRQLVKTGILTVKERLEDHPEFMHVFRNVWADHADTISKAYSGTGALKTDFTRTGMRTKQGMLQDGVNSVTRYVKNNFFDGSRQDSYDLLTGAWIAKRGAIPPLSDTRPLFAKSMPYILAFALFMMFAGLTFPRAADIAINSYMFLWVILAVLSGTYMWGNGTSYVAWPRLNPPYEILRYEGAGYRSPARGRGMSFVTPAFVGAANRYQREANKRAKTTRTEEIELGRRKGNLID
ncbi:hypothetical protein QFC22_000998 [Naganishia vaughanmartiniae]|uniref:Uncharacterized protein n=1 Tax=Naganishia vaughanmartiniae TaxID=1424756 RepID=A0ACC2XLF1_9TREE|nr:hypothetical protein QFC22_000998 [Naganishia vaughanmartiniae]